MAWKRFFQAMGGSWTGELQADGGGLACECKHAAPQGVSPSSCLLAGGIGELRERSPGEAGAGGSERDKANGSVSLENYACRTRQLNLIRREKTARIDGGKMEIKSCCCCRRR